MRTIYRVRFKEPPLSGDERTEFFFTSLAAIYEVFTAEQIGCRVNRLYNIGLPDGKPYRGRRCEISVKIFTAKRRKPRIRAQIFQMIVYTNRKSKAFYGRIREK